MPTLRVPHRDPEPHHVVGIVETPDEFSMSIKPPPVSFDMIEDLGRVCGSIKAMAELGASKCDEQTLRRISRLVMIERELRNIVHADILHKRSVDHRHSVLFPAYRSFDDASDGDGVKLIVQDLQAVWSGEKWVGDGACTLNKWANGGGRATTRWVGGDKPEVPCVYHPYSPKTWPQRAVIMHTSFDQWRVGERAVTGRSYIPPRESFGFFDLKPGDYITGELYVEIC